MPVPLTLPKHPQRPLALDPSQIYALGLEHVRRLAGEVWTDHNAHDPGITILELFCYALTDLSYRASFPVADLLASATPGTGHSTLFTPREILPSRPLTALDHRKLLIDLPGVKNAWILPANVAIFADTIEGRLLDVHPGLPGVVPVRLGGVFDVALDFMDGITTSAQRDAVITAARARLQANRNLCQDWGEISGVAIEDFNLCAEIELAADADVSSVRAAILFEVGRGLAPPVHVYTLGEMLARAHPDGTPRTLDEVFEGPALDCGFLDEDELIDTSLPTQLRLSDVIGVVMDVPGVVAVRDILLTSTGATVGLENRWVIPVTPRHRPALRRESSRLVFTKSNVPVVADETAVSRILGELVEAARQKLETPTREDLAAPAGRRRDTITYVSFQNLFPAVYGIGSEGLERDADERRKILAQQLKGYLLFFDQIMADTLAALGDVATLFSTDGDVLRTRSHQAVAALAGIEALYDPATIEAALEAADDDTHEQIARRSRFLDHLIARFAERFHEFVGFTQSAFGTSPEEAIGLKARFLADYPEVSRGRGMGMDTTQREVWDTDHVSGYERRLARLLGLADIRVRNLSDVNDGEGMFVIENILLRKQRADDPFVPICPDPNCTDCAGADPYSFRMHVILPAYGARFSNMAFRHYVEQVVRAEAPAHVLPKVCWLSAEDMAAVEGPYRAWLSADADAGERGARLADLIEVLYRVKSSYPERRLGAPGSDVEPFLLGQTAIGGTTPRPPTNT